MAHYEPSGHYQRQLIQQLADSDWGVHQIFLVQSATISHMHSLSRKLAADPDNADLLAADARAVRKLATLNSYENRKRRASKMLREQIDEISLQESVAPKPPSKPMETKPEPEIGFVSPDVYQTVLNEGYERADDATEALFQRLAKCTDPKEAREIYKKLGMIL